ncbi:atherin-like [Onychomys torridus]|uniref:atherin-like n=1 Tax=Onychomys torridus TaxID=38674 RepID=UPI00167F940D|nr:atherin-like [Onychomys torridus]
MRALLSRGVLRLRALGGHFIAAGPLVHSPGRPAATARLLLGSARRRPEPRSAREGAGGDRSPKRRRAGRPGRGGGARGRSPAERASAWCPRRWRRRMRGAAAAVTAPPAPPPRAPPPRARAAGGTRATSGPYQPPGLRRGPTLDPSPSLVSPPRAPRSSPPAGATWASGVGAAAGGAQGTPALARRVRASTSKAEVSRRGRNRTLPE